jgi:hypothetical protein
MSRSKRIIPIVAVIVVVVVVAVSVLSLGWCGTAAVGIVAWLRL